jgi:hypothetical protein
MEISDLSSVQALVPTQTGIGETRAEDIEEMMENAPPDQIVKKMILEKMFGREKEEKAGAGDEKKAVIQNPDQPAQDQPAPKDTVTLSRTALELYNREKVEINVENGDQRLRIGYEREDALRIEEQQVQAAEPLVLDLNGNGLELTDVTKNEGVIFDITGDGSKEVVSWVAPSDGFLAYDKNGNGIIDNGKELFGDQNGARNGFEELAKYDTDSNGLIDHNDLVFNSLSVWQDHNRDGVTDEGELRSMDEAGIRAIGLSPDMTTHYIAGNLVSGYSRYESEDNGSKAVGEVFLNYLV